MPQLKEFDKGVSFGDQMQSEDVGSVVLINVYTVAAEEVEAFIAVWSDHSDFMKAQPGYISTQLHRGIGGSSSFVNYAIWESADSFRKAFTSEELQRRIGNYPPSVVISPHLLRKTAVKDHCVA